MRGFAWVAMIAAVTIIVSAFLVYMFSGLQEKESATEAANNAAPVSVNGPSVGGVPLPVDKSGNIEYTPETFDIISTALFGNVYRLLARQIYGDYGVNKGLCIDVGSGPCGLSLELAKITNLQFYALDIDPGAFPIARQKLTETGLMERFSLITGDAQDLPFKDNLADLIISRGSFLFWDDKVAGFREAYRVLKPGGIAFIGGGMGRLLPQEEMRRIGRELKRLRYGPRYWGVGAPSVYEMEDILKKAGIPTAKYKI
ncbi:MAG: methyltransferase domain-containing protein, partial [Candidatus Coatesbacteria bacterium]|nr:methyltransferase domain-containing protein [Candidatus Coatesbacteria bacterium]